MAVLDQLERDGFSEVESRLAHYILEHADEVVHLTIAELARASFTSKATVVRLCHKLGLGGYRELKVELAAALERRRSARRDIDPDYPFGRDADTAEVVARIAQLTHEAVDAAYGALDVRTVHEVAQWIRQANTVFVFAQGDTQITSEGFLNLLLKLGVRGMLAGRRAEEVSVAHAAQPGDVALFVTYGGALLDEDATRRVLPVLRERGCRIVAVTAAPRDSVWVDRTVAFPQRERLLGKMATFYSQTCIRYILNCLYAAVFALDYAQSAAAKDSVDGVPTSER